ncbi:hypothetical protein AGMMS49991_10330 [Spirochaetia bacterium]|nr:hypothetical protein AGMMS49991_10330 [Spirochaetia bacterium]
MDIREKTNNVNRHPWELSRARCIIKLIKNCNLQSFVDIGAGDRFFTTQLLNIASGKVYAVDSAYTEKSMYINGICCLNDIAELPEIGAGGGADHDGCS